MVKQAYIAVQKYVAGLFDADGRSLCHLLDRQSVLKQRERACVGAPFYVPIPHSAQPTLTHLHKADKHEK